MITFTSGAEYHFRQLIENLSTDKPNWRVYHFLTSQVRKGVSVKEATKVAYNIIQNFIKEQEGAVFFCEDGDIIIMYHTKSATLMEEMAYQLHYLFAENINDKNAVEFMHLYDADADFTKIQALAQAKVQATVKVGEIAPTVEKEQSSLNTLLPTDSERKLFAAAAAKRFQREERHILIVEDDPLSLRLVKNVLQAEYKITTAGTGQEAYDSYIRNAPNIVFLDIGLPDSNGLQILEKMLALDSSAYIIMLSGHTYQEAIMQAMKTGARGFVGKPFTRDRLIRYINGANN
jgi:two-component system chemotaxis response regulator CheY